MLSLLLHIFTFPIAGIPMKMDKINAENLALISIDLDILFWNKMARQRNHQANAFIFAQTLMILN